MENVIRNLGISGDKMILNEVLQLDKVQGSIKKIDLFLVSQIKLSDEYLIALSYKAIILHTIGKTNDALKLLFGMVPSFKEMGVNGIISICDGIIDICLDLKRYDQVTKYIKIKQNYLPISKSVLHVKDNIKYFLAIKKYDSAKEALLKYLEDDITSEEKIFAKEELSKIYYFERQYNKYLEILPELENYYQTNLALGALADLGLNKLKIFYEMGNYLKVITDGSIYIKDDALKPHHILTCATLLMKSYLASNDFKRASIVESDYYELLTKDCKEESLEFCYAALELYTRTNTLVSITEYQNKIREFEVLKKETKTNKKNNIKKEEEVVIPIIQEEIIEEPKKPIIFKLEPQNKEEINQKINVNIEKIKDVIVSKNYENLEAIFNTLSELDLKLKFREIFRIFCIKLCEIFPIEEVYLLYFKRKYLGLHYKKERAYDKKLQFEDVDQTLNFMAMNYDNEAFLDSKDENIKDIVSGKEYIDIPFGFAVPLRDNLKPIGSLAFFSKTAFLEQEMVYESLKLVSSMLNARLWMAMYQEETEYNHRKTFFINENMSSGIKEEMEGCLHFSSACCKILGVLENMTEEDYFSKMKTNDIIEYRRIHDELYSLLSDNLSLEYDFKKEDQWIRIKERYYPMVYEGTICILSLIDDITRIHQNENDLIQLAYKNPISKMDTEIKLMVDLTKEMENKKLSLAVLDIIDFSLYRELYGYNFANQLIFTIGKELIQAFENDFNTSIYHLEGERYVLLFHNVNDKRIIDSKLIQTFKKVSDNLFKLNSRVKLLFNAGVYRLARHSVIDDASKILYYAMDALDDARAMEQIGNHIAHFDSDLHKKKFNENHLITHISESIDHGKLGLTYKQIIHLTDQTVYAYRIMLNLDNYEVDYSYMDFVIQRRGLTIQIEKYAISNIYKELKMLKDSVKGYILCFIYVSQPTLEENFLNFLEAQENFYKIPKDYIVFIVDHANTSIVRFLHQKEYKIASKDILDVYNENCDYFMFDYHQTNVEAAKEINELCIKHNCQCIFDHMDTKEDIEFAKDNQIEIIYGEYYKKAQRIKSLIEKLR